MHLATPIPYCVAGLASALSLSFGQSFDPEFDSTSGASVVMTDVDLTIPDYETVPPGGFAPVPAEWQGRPDSKAPSGIPEGAPAGIASISLRRSMTEAMVDEGPDGAVWVRTRDFRASFTSEGFTAYPIFGATSPQEWPVQFRLRSAGRGDTELGLDQEGEPIYRDGAVTLRHRSLNQVFHLGLDSVEQTFVFDSVPGDGDLLVELEVNTELTSEFDGRSLRFVHSEFGGVDYGEAVVIDGAGRTQSIERTWRDGTIRFLVPAQFLDEAELPITIDPVISTFSNGFGNTSDDAFPDVCFGGDPGRYYVCWQELTSVANADVYCTSFDPSGNQGPSWPVEITSEIWQTPRIAHVPAFGRLLVVAQDVNTLQGAIVARLSSTTTNDTVGAPFFVSSVGDAKIQPCVGGTNRRSTQNNHFIVAWIRANTPTTWSLEHRLIDWTGNPVTNVGVLDFVPDRRATHPAVSKSYGDATLPVDLWTLVWIHDCGSIGCGEVWARRIAWNGGFPGPTNFRVDTSGSCKWPTVTSRFDEPLASTGDRPSVVAWTERVPGFNMSNTNILASVIGTGVAYPPCDITLDYEDFAPVVDQYRPSIGTDGSAFVLAYTEESFSNPGSNDHDIYMVSGSIAGHELAPRVALMERHQVVRDSSETDIHVQVAMQRDGDHRFVTDEGFCVLSTLPFPTADYGSTWIASLEAATTAGTPDRAVGVQYCNSVPNSIGNATDQITGSWLLVEGTQALNQVHTLRCVDMPAQQFGLLIAATETGNILFPGGSAGRLCLGGQLGRYNSQIASSGPTGVFTASIDPQAIEQPNGPVASAPGETWFFQVWHRDLNPMGQATSNFSNACAVTFRQ